MNLILLANGFPYGNWEPFLETEVNYYDGFDSVHICSMQLRKDHRKTCRPLPPEKFHVCPVPFAPQPVYALGIIRSLKDKNLWRELKRLRKARALTFSRLAWLLFYMSRSHHEAAIIEKYLRREGLAGQGEETVIYSYRFDYQPYVALLLQKRLLPGCRIVARGHRYDLYEEKRANGYIPLRPYLLEHLDQVILIAQDGLNYLAEKYPAWKHKLLLYPLGTIDHGVRPASLAGRSIRLVSCSVLVDVKRVDLIVKALSQITDIDVTWVHYGNGPLCPDIKAQCQTLPPNIHWSLPGHISNANLMNIYAQEPFHLFINVSSSEGLPVSIMEAMSFGIPCIATAVGGTAEIVRPGLTGVLLQPDFDPQELAGHIRDFAAMGDREYQTYRSNARRFWMEHFSANTNYTAFAAYLKNLGGSHS